MSKFFYECVPRFRSPKHLEELKKKLLYFFFRFFFHPLSCFQNIRKADQPSSAISTPGLMCFFLLGGKPPRPTNLLIHQYRFRLSPFRLSLFLQKCFILLGGKPPRPPTLFNHPYRFRLKSVLLKSILSVSRNICIFRLWSIEEKTV